MKLILDFLQNNIIESYIIIDDNANIVQFSKNLDYIDNLKKLIWLEASDKFNFFLDILFKDGKNEGKFEILNEWNQYELATFFATKLPEESNQYLILIGKDSEIQKNKNNELNTKTHFIRDLASLFKGFYFTLDKDLNFIEIFGSIFEITGFSQNELMDNLKNIVNLVVEEDRENFIILHNYKNITTVNEEYTFRIKCKDNSDRWVSEEYRLFTINNQTHIKGIIYDIDKLKTNENELLSKNDKLTKLANHLEQVREQERKEMAREIHDEIGHALTSMKLDINLLLKKKFLREDALETRLTDIMKQIEETIRTLQRISSQLRPSILDHFGLFAAIEWQAKEFQRQTSVRCKYNLPAEDIELSEPKTIAIFRIFQEILTNIARHSQATRVDVDLSIENNILELKVSDNGIGIKKENFESPKSLGLIGMRERANLINGKLYINSVLNVGTTIILNVSIN
jgi:PAS domain S-box-containing protein